MSYEPPLIDLAPLVITPQIAAAVRAQEPEAPLTITPQIAATVRAEEQPAAETGGAVDQLKA
eukprot:scaffold16686_cov66-Phaeocystis_antarctica.AAC.1